ncbi:MAG: hypothetical protein V3S32_09930 [Acidimicrobiia bacterium]
MTDRDVAEKWYNPTLGFESESDLSSANLFVEQSCLWVVADAWLGVRAVAGSSLLS